MPDTGWSAIAERKRNGSNRVLVDERNWVFVEWENEHLAGRGAFCTASKELSLYMGGRLGPSVQMTSPPWREDGVKLPRAARGWAAMCGFAARPQGKRHSVLNGLISAERSTVHGYHFANLKEGLLAETVWNVPSVSADRLRNNGADTHTLKERK